MTGDDLNFDKKSPNLELRLEIDDQLTWGELIKFVDLARESNVRPGEPVLPVYDRDRDQYTHLAIYLRPEDLGASRE